MPDNTTKDDKIVSFADHKHAKQKEREAEDDIDARMERLDRLFKRANDTCCALATLHDCRDINLIIGMMQQVFFEAHPNVTLSQIAQDLDNLKETILGALATSGRR